MIRPLEYRVLVQPDRIEETDPALKRARESIPGFEMADQTSEREQMAQVHATVKAIGGNAFEDWNDERLPKVGDRVLIAKYAGVVVPGTEEDDQPLRIVNDKDLCAIID